MSTGIPMSIPPEIESKLDQLVPSFEEYLPDEKISRIWEEVEIISTENPDFETVFFRYDLDELLILVSSDFEFFPFYVLSLFQSSGWPLFAYNGNLNLYDQIDIPEGQEVIVFAVANPKKKDNLSKLLPSVTDKTLIEPQQLFDWINLVLEDL